MAVPYSNDLRERVINALEKGSSVKEIVSTFGVTKSTIYSWRKMYIETGSYDALPLNSGRKPALSVEQTEEIKERILSQPDITLEELKEELKLPVCISALCRTINNKLNLRYKKNSTRKRTK